MSSRFAGPKPDGICLCCREPIQPNWDTSVEMSSKWFCSSDCIARDWLRWAQVPHTFWRFNSSLPSCGPERIRIAKEWMEAPNLVRRIREFCLAINFDP
jgi:hypothetical protein